MIQSWKEVLPGDHYLVRSKGVLHAYDQKVVTCLYQPLIGLEAASLYFTYWQELGMGTDTVSATHHHLMAMLNLPLDSILRARKKLEAVGLLKTLKKKNVDPAFFVYQLNPPLAPNQFFHDEVLPVFLFHQIGARDYQRLSDFFMTEQLPSGDFEDLSATFDDVFESLPSGTHPSLAEQANSDWQENQPASTPVRLKKTFNFKALQGYLSEAIVSEEALTPEVCDVVEKLAFLYQTDPFDMSRAIEAASLHTGTVAIDALRREVRDFYQVEQGPGEQPALVERTQPVSEREIVGKEPQTEEEKLIAWYEAISPYQMLEQLSDGGKPAATDLKLAESLMIDMKLNPGVINVLLHYISKINDHNLNKSFVESVAATWSRAHIRTVPQAMAIARQEKRKRDALKRETKNKKTRTRSVNQNTRQEVVPEWMKKDHAKRPDAQTAISPEEAQKRAKWLEDYLNSI
ncbi:replication initiation and membrane attachment family protein [Sporolactobacillus spathodeae]|uniref:Replication initiation and membrane attachment protein n=1 Tax=Sporolactobacillus spathodeae TaxID=1465502 RepID=A0ABS2QBE4_9BACL|nr:DnaD domain protein [Sporolactobacillus spathodeae]MBM7658725.1 replication initiation and membrane attachment protein [Sporolactobacillus spathodeae]